MGFPGTLECSCHASRELLVGHFLVFLNCQMKHSIYLPFRNRCKGVFYTVLARGEGGNESWILVRWELGQWLQESETKLSQDGKLQFWRT